MTFSHTETISFTVTHARHLAAKVVTDLKRIQRFYGSPGDDDITDYAIEAIQLMRYGYLGVVTYGFRRNGNWIEPALRYTARELAGASADDNDPGRVRPGADTTAAVLTSHLTYSDEWWQLSRDERVAFKKSLPFQRVAASEPGVSGYFIPDRTYSSGGRALDRASVRSY